MGRPLISLPLLCFSLKHREYPQRVFDLMPLGMVVGIAYQTSQAFSDRASGKDVYTSVKRGDLSGMSFSFTTRRDNWSASGSKRELLGVSLREIFVLAFPAYEQTSVEARSRSIGLPVDAEIQLTVAFRQ